MSTHDLYRGSTELVQHSDHWGSSHRRKGATSNAIDLVWLYRLPIPVRKEGVFYFYLPVVVATGGGGGRQYPVVPIQMQLSSAISMHGQHGAKAYFSKFEHRSRQETTHDNQGYATNRGQEKG